MAKCVVGAAWRCAAFAQSALLHDADVECACNLHADLTTVNTPLQSRATVRCSCQALHQRAAPAHLRQLKAQDGAKGAASCTPATKPVGAPELPGPTCATAYVGLRGIGEPGSLAGGDAHTLGDVSATISLCSALALPLAKGSVSATHLHDSHCKWSAQRDGGAQRSTRQGARTTLTALPITPSPPGRPHTGCCRTRCPASPPSQQLQLIPQAARLQ